MNASPLKLQNRFEELNIYGTSESVATDSTNISIIEGVSSIKKHSVVKQTACLIFCSNNWSTGEIEFMQCPSECNMAKPEKKKTAYIARAFIYKASIEEAENDDEGKAVFTCHKGTYEPLVMFFGLYNSLATFQTMMNDIFHNMPAVIVYIDDILIFMKTKRDHDKIVMEVLHRLKENDLFVKQEKCFFKVQEVEMLGLIIGPDGIKMDSKKLKQSWPGLCQQRSRRSNHS